MSDQEQYGPAWIQASHNSDYAAALFSELKRIAASGPVEFKDDWVPVTEERLNAALKAAQHCA